MDKFTSFILGSLRFLLIGNPYRTALGVVLELAVNVLAQVFKPLIERQLGDYVDISMMTEFNCIFLGLVFIYLPAIFSFIGSPKKELLDEHTEKIFRLIRLAAHEVGLSKFELRKLYFTILQKAVEQVNFNPTTQKELEKFVGIQEVQEEEQKE